MVDSTWTTVWGKGKIQLYVCACQLVVSNPNRIIKSVTLSALMVESDSVLDFRLRRDFYDYHSRHSKTNKVLSMMSHGRPADPDDK